MKKTETKEKIKSIKHKIKRQKIIKISIAGLGIIALLFLGLAIYGKAHVVQVEHDRNAVTLKRRASLVLFYRDNCPDCNKIFAQVLAAKDAGIPVQFVNTLNQKNRENYLDDYDIKVVPTFILLDINGEEVVRYSGTNTKKINELLKKAGAINYE